MNEQQHYEERILLLGLEKALAASQTQLRAILSAYEAMMDEKTFLCLRWAEAGLQEATIASMQQWKHLYDPVP